MSALDTDAIAARLENATDCTGPIGDRVDFKAALLHAEFHAYAPGDIAALLAEVATLKREYALLMESHQGMANENLRLGGIIQTLREALQPFAAKAEQWDAVHVMPEWCSTDVALGDLRRARSVLEGGREEPQQ